MIAARTARCASHPANLGRLRPAGPLINRRERQKPPRLGSVLALFRPRTNRNSIKIGPERNSHDEPPSFATLNQTQADSEILIQVTLPELWYITLDFALALTTTTPLRPGQSWRS